MTVSTSLTLQALLKAAASRTGMTLPARNLSGLSPAAKALVVASSAASDTTVVVIVPTDPGVDEMTGDIRFFLGALEGFSAGTAADAVLPFPSHGVDPYRGLLPHLRVASARARALHSMATRTARVVVASAAALLPRLSPPDRALAASVRLKPGSEIAPQALADLLVDAGFAREDPVDEHGEFCVRGGVVDIFPAGELRPVRLEFVGDTVESIRSFDPATQRSTGVLDQLTVVPLRDVFPKTDGQWAADSGQAEDDSGALADAPGRSAPAEDDCSASFFDFLAQARRALVFESEAEEVHAQADRFAEQLQTSYADALARGTHRGPLSPGPAGPVPSVPDPAALFTSWADVEAMTPSVTQLEQLGIGEIPPGSVATQASPGERHISCQPAIAFHGRVADWAAAIRQGRDGGDTVLFVAASQGRAERTIELLREYELRAALTDQHEDARTAHVLVTTGSLSSGFRLPDAALQIYAETDVFEEERRAPERRPAPARAFLSDLRDLKAGDLVVHVDHGIGVFVGLKQIAVGPLGDATQEFLELRYAGDDKLFVPVDRLDLIQKYQGGSRPPLDRLGGASWERAKTRVKRAMRDMAEELLKLYAARKAIPGHAFGHDSHWQQEFEDVFEYEPTPDQQLAISEIKRDMESPMPMDRLLCGDVGYGKTEVALRAAFKAVMDGKQVAFLAPTTVLAFQHVKTLGHRFAAFPVRIEMISRFRSKAEQRQVLADLAAGRIDIIVGTHRLLSKDVEFRDLGLLVVDEEQRFGVAHKERIKQLRRRVDVLTMTATPIPRTLNMSLAGIRDMSIIETPPKDRLSIQTYVVTFDQRVITRAITNELARGGQVYFVHNRVESIASIANLLKRLVPDARVVVAHGQMSEDALEHAMVDFVDRKYDVLLATTIVENGLDIPNVNTIIINRADRHGLSQLYQLRGRVGRSDRPAYAYLLIPPEDALSTTARKRLAAIREFSDLGSGFRVAALDLEIRGAGNLLGGEQSGHIEAVGFEMYLKLLEQTVRELKGEDVAEDVRAAVNLGVDLRIDDDYVPDMNQRLILYRRAAGARTDQELDELLEEIRDRYGPLPDSVLNLAEYGRLRMMADRLDVESIDRQGPVVVLRFRADAARPGSPSSERRPPEPAHLLRLLRRRPDVTLAPPGLLKLEVKPPSERGVSSTARPAPASPGTRTLGMSAGRALRAGDQASGTRGRLHGDRAGASWWTARAREGEVKPGFTKEAILRPDPEDPRGPEGVFARVAELLSDLLETG